MRFLRVSGASVLIAFFALACAKKSPESSSAADSSAGQNQIALAQTDISAMAFASTDGANRVDGKGGRLYSAVFGGVGGNAIQKYYTDRVHHLIDLEKSKQLIHGKITNDHWLDEPADPTATPDPGVKAEVGAANVGAVYWLRGVVNDAVVAFKDQDQNVIVMDTPRTGVIGFGSGYKKTITTDDGKKITIPQAYRQSILIHEARHSDCTGGVSSHLLETMRSAKDYGDFTKTVNVMACGHLHVTCTRGDLVGFTACDNELFGAYSVAGIFALAEYYDADKTGLDATQKEILKVRIIDMFSRLEKLQDLGEFLSGKMNQLPDMTSQGLLK